MNLIDNSNLYGHPATQTSAGLVWPGLQVERYQLEAMDVPPHFHEHHLLVLFQGATPVLSRRHSGSRIDESLFRAGDAGLYPRGEYGPLGLDGPTDTIHLKIDAQGLEMRARQSLNLTHFALRDRLRFEDGMITQLGRQLLQEINREHALGHLYVESLANALSYHLIEHHATFEQRITGTQNRLPNAVMAQLDEYLEAASDQPITLEQLAGLSNLSVFHFARRFKLTTGLSPYQYVLNWKIQRAQQMLRADTMPIADIGDLLGFASPAHFSAAFRRAVGQSPREFQRAQSVGIYPVKHALDVEPAGKMSKNL